MNFNRIHQKPKVLLAPNGQPSNLTPEQYRLVRTPAFKKWFGDWENSPETASKVVDENGEPMVVYHGTVYDWEEPFYEFKNKETKGWTGSERGHFFTANKNHAQHWADNAYTFTEITYESTRIIGVFLNIRDFYEYDKMGEQLSHKDRSVNQEILKNKDVIVRNSIDIFGEFGDEPATLISDIFIVRESNQIKLADGINTTFDSNNPDIRYDDGGSIEEIKNYLKNIRVDKDYMESESDLSIVQYQSDFGRKGTLVWRAYPEWGKDGLSEDVKGSIYISSISRGTGGDIYSFVSSIEGKKDSRGEGAMALASLFLRYPLVHSVHYEDKSGFEDELGYYKISFWQKIGGDESELMREDFFNYFTKKFGYNPDTKTQHLLERYKLLEELAEEIKEKPKNLSYYKRLVALKEKRKKYIESINPDIKFKNGGLTIKKPKAKLLAPNGKPSNLTPEQYRLVRTPAFKKWFGDWENSPETASKVVDEETKEPLVVFHGSERSDSILMSGIFEAYGSELNELYFTDNINTALSYTYDELWDEEEEEGIATEENIDNVIAVFLNIKNPKIKDLKGRTFTDFWNIKKDNDGNILTNVYDVRGINEKLKRKDYLGNTYVVYESYQIKLADGSNTTFDGSNPDIRYADGGVTEVSLEKLKKTNIKKYNNIFKNYEGFYHQTTKKSIEKITKNGFNTTEIWLAPDENANYGEYDESTGKPYSIEVYVPRLKKPFVMDSIMADYGEYGQTENSINKNLSFYEKLGGEANPKTFDKLRQLGYDSIIEEGGDRAYLYPQKAIIDNPKFISKAYNKSKIDGSNPELVKAVTNAIRYADGGSLTMRKPKTKLLAPNGKPSNLTPEQYKLVRTPEFKAWFGDWENSPETASKVVDGNGEPIPVYHGSPYGTLFNVFDGSDRGNWFGEDIKIAETYRDKYLMEQLYDDKEIEERKKERKIFNVFLKAKKIYDLSFIDAQAEQTKEEFNKIFPVNLRWGGYKTIGTPHWELFDASYDIIKEWLIKNKYDCIKIKERGYITYGVFKPTQIKLADGINTTFDSNNPDIRYAEGGSIPDLLSSQEVEYKLGRKLDWWNDDIVYLSGIEYKKVYLRPEYKKIN